MMQDLTIRHKIKIPTHGIVGTASLTFHLWFPFDDQDKIVISRDEYDVVLWFDKSCLYIGHKNQDLSKQINVLCEEIFVDVKIKNVSKTLISFLKRNIQEMTDEDKELEQQAEEFGKKVYLLCVTNVNKFINYCRYIKGQYWLEEINENTKRIQDFNYQAKAKATDNIKDEQAWFRWRPIHSSAIIVTVSGDETYISKEEWEVVKDFFNMEKRIDFSLELLAKSKVLRSYGYGNNAIVDSVIALEIALNQFGKKPNIHKLIEAGASERIDLKTLNKTFAHLGFTASVKHLLPLILPHALVDNTTFQSVNEIISIRQNIIHNGQKKVHRDKLRLMEASERLTKLLMELTSDN